MHNLLHHRFGQHSILFIIAFIVIGVLFVTTIFQKEDAVVERSQQPFAPDIYVGTTLAPVADLVRAVGGERVTVTVWDSAEEYLQRPMGSDASLWFVVGEGVDEWVGETVSDAEIVLLRDDVDIAKLEYEVEIGKVDPAAPHYYWMSFRGLQNMTIAIARELNLVDKVNTEMYISNAYQYSLTLAEHNNEYKNTIDDVGPINVIAMDHLFDEFLYYFGLNVVGLFNMEGDRQEALEDLVYNARYYEVDVVLVPQGYNINDITRALADISIKIVSLDVYGEGMKDVVGFVRENVSALLLGAQ